MAEPSIRVSHESLKVIPGKHVRVLHKMYEDSDLDGAEKAENFIGFLEQEAPGTFVAILANDSVTPSCIHGSGNLDHFHCDHYNPYWYTCLVSKKVWDQYEAQVEVEDQKWKDLHQCKGADVSNPNTEAAKSGRVCGVCLEDLGEQSRVVHICPGAFF